MPSRMNEGDFVDPSRTKGQIAFVRSSIQTSADVIAARQIIPKHRFIFKQSVYCWSGTCVSRDRRRLLRLAPDGWRSRSSNYEVLHLACASKRLNDNLRII